MLSYKETCNMLACLAAKIQSSTLHVPCTTDHDANDASLPPAPLFRKHSLEKTAIEELQYLITGTAVVRWRSSHLERLLINHAHSMTHQWILKCKVLAKPFEWSTYLHALCLATKKHLLYAFFRQRTTNRMIHLSRLLLTIRAQRTGNMILYS